MVPKGTTINNLGGGGLAEATKKKKKKKRKEATKKKIGMSPKNKVQHLQETVKDG